MASAKALFGAAFGRFFFRSATVTRVRELGERFRVVELEGEDLREVTWTPGDKVQVFLAGEGMRTYTPMEWDGAAGKTSFLVYVHDAYTPGAAWARRVAAGARCQFFGPRGSIAFPELAEPILFVGDETSLAAARALRDVRASKLVFEVADEPATRRVLAELGLEATLVERRTDDAHLGDLADAIASACTGTGTLVATGRAQTIQALRARGLRPSKTKAYWSVGKAGLD